MNPDDYPDSTDAALIKMGPTIKEAIEEAAIIIAAAQIAIAANQTDASNDVEVYAEQLAKARKLIKEHLNRR